MRVVMSDVRWRSFRFRSPPTIRSIAIFSPGGRPDGMPCVTLPMYKQDMSVRRQQLTMLANLVEVSLANVGHAQVRSDGRIERPLRTSGDTLLTMREFVNGRTRYSAAEVVGYLTSSSAASQRTEPFEVGNA